MSPAHWHLVLTHAPLFGIILGCLLLFVAALQKNDDLKRLGLWIFVFAGLLVVPTYLTGAPADAELKRLYPTMPMETADQHEEIAVLALVAVLFAMLLSIAGLVIFPKGKRVPGWFAGLVLGIALLATGALAWTADLGGKVRHVEIRNEPPEPGRSGH